MPTLACPGPIDASPVCTVPHAQQGCHARRLSACASQRHARHKDFCWQPRAPDLALEHQPCRHFLQRRPMLPPGGLLRRQAAPAAPAAIHAAAGSARCPRAEPHALECTHCFAGESSCRTCQRMSQAHLLCWPNLRQGRALERPMCARRGRAACRMALPGFPQVLGSIASTPARWQLRRPQALGWCLHNGRPLHPARVARRPRREEVRFREEPSCT